MPFVGRYCCWLKTTGRPMRREALPSIRGWSTVSSQRPNSSARCNANDEKGGPSAVQLERVEKREASSCSLSWLTLCLPHDCLSCIAQLEAQVSQIASNSFKLVVVNNYIREEVEKERKGRNNVTSLSLSLLAFCCFESRVGMFAGLLLPSLVGALKRASCFTHRRREKRQALPTHVQ